MKTLYEILRESAELYSNFLELEYKKYEFIIKDDTLSLDETVAEEQAFYMKMRGLEQKRIAYIEKMGMKDKTLAEIIELSGDDDKAILKEAYDELNRLITEVKKISDLCKLVIEVRLRRIDRAMSKLGQKENTYSNEDVKNNNTKSFLLSKKI
ncbi:flagellar protein FlgN [Sedimentibacter sp. B4]|uniref:flagellar protein FlgN n=1 Tax=Sedimentibacter sp. B4 TaxID=304766 RepID=UPI0002FF132F|nr:flagellar protein FlgN [Sedimentibacter sp. B4]